MNKLTQGLMTFDCLRYRGFEAGWAFNIVRFSSTRILIPQHNTILVVSKNLPVLSLSKITGIYEKLAYAEAS